MIRLFFLLMTISLAAQNVTLSKVVHAREKSDKILYKLPAPAPGSEYLGEVEVSTSAARTAALFSEFYKKAKEIGANTFVDASSDGIPVINAPVFRLALYYTPGKDIQQENNTVYILSTEDKLQKLSVNNKNIALQPNTYLRISLLPGSPLSISTRSFLGSSVRLMYSETQPVQYFNITSLRFSQNPDGSPGIRLKSGDINGLERSYAEFLMIGRTAAQF